jgi:hypothetical protein
MRPSVRFERSHEIVIDAPAGDILDYVSNPNSWPEWIAASHHIDGTIRVAARFQASTHKALEKVYQMRSNSTLDGTKALQTY